MQSDYTNKCTTKPQQVGQSRALTSRDFLLFKTTRMKVGGTEIPPACEGIALVERLAWDGLDVRYHVDGNKG